MKYCALAAIFVIACGEIIDERDYIFYTCDDPPCVPGEQCCVRTSGEVYACSQLGKKGSFCSTYPLWDTPPYWGTNNTYARNCPCREGLVCRTPKSNKRAMKCLRPKRRNRTNSGS